MEQNKNDPRATVVCHVHEEQQLISTVLQAIPAAQDIDIEILISLYERCAQIRQQPEFIEALFENKPLYSEFLWCVLSPKKVLGETVCVNGSIAEKQQKLRYPHRCSQIAKENPSFYEQLYLKASFEDKYLWEWFQFLKENDQQTVQTSFGYFTEIMIPFLTYEFADSSKICEVFEDLAKNERNSQCSSEMSAIQIDAEYKKFSSTYNISILKIFPEQLLEFIYGYIHHEAVFKFLHTLILASLEEDDLKRSKKAFEKFLKKTMDTSIAQNFSQTEICSSYFDSCIGYMHQLLTEVYENANTDKNYRVIFFIDSIIREELIVEYISRVEKSALSSENLEKVCSDIEVEEEAIQTCLKCLCLFVNIYTKMTKNQKTEEQSERQSKFYFNDLDDTEESNCNDRGYAKIMSEFSIQITLIINKLPSLSKLVRRNQSKILPFSSGQNIKPITLYKFEYFQLVYHCLILARQYPDKFILDTDKFNLFSIVQKYLNENRWSNIAHRVLEKIANLLIVNNDNFFKTKQMNQNNMADEFLNGLIESFTNKRHIFLNSLRFTNQGNIHTIYMIAKAIIYELKKSQKLANFIHEVDYYKKFVMNDLQTYETKVFEIKYLADQDQIRSSERKYSEDSIRLSVDEISIKQIVKKIEIVAKWPVKETKKKAGSVILRPMSERRDNYAFNYLPVQSVKAKTSNLSFLQSEGMNQDNKQELRSKSMMVCKNDRDFFKSAIQSQRQIESTNSRAQIVVQDVQNVSNLNVFQHYTKSQSITQQADDDNFEKNAENEQNTIINVTLAIEKKTVEHQDENIEYFHTNETDSQTNE